MVDPPLTDQLSLWVLSVLLAVAHNSERGRLSSRFCPCFYPVARFSLALSQLLSSFKESTRSDGSKHLILSAGSPDWMTEAVREAHDEELPNDSRYQLIRDCLQALSDDGVESLEEALEASYELSKDLVPVFTGELLQWFSQMPRRLGDCDEALNRERVSELTSYEILSQGFRLAAEEVISSLADSLEDAADSLLDPDTDSELLLSDSHGIYIPKLWCDELSEEEAERFGVSWGSVLVCQSGPDEEHYWEAWQEILDSAEWEEDGVEWRLYQNGDLWRVRSDAQLPEEF